MGEDPRQANTFRTGQPPRDGHADRPDPPAPPLDGATSLAEPHPGAAPASAARPVVVRNAMMNLFGEFVFIVNGFIWPRLMLDFFTRRHSSPAVAQALTGVWDFGWETVVALKLLNAGIASSVNRFVAHHRATENWEGLNRSVSACGTIFIVTSTLAAVLTVALTARLSWFISDQLEPYLVDAQWVIFFLGLLCAVEMFMSTYHGVITGSQRYDVAAWIQIGEVVGQLICLSALLAMGMGLRAIAVAVFAAKLIESSAVWVLAHRVCPRLRFSPRLVRRQDVVEVTRFGIKTFINYASEAVAGTGSSWLIVNLLGPRHLTWLKRSMALIRASRKGMFQVTRVLTPLSSEAQARGEQGGVRHLTLQAMRYGLLAGLPGTLALAVLGKPLLRLWLGADHPEFYSQPLLAILALGNLALLTMMGPRSVMMGLNRHGWAGILNFTGGLLSLGLIVVALVVLKLGIVGVAAAIAASHILVDLIGMPIAVARGTGLPIRRMLRLIPECAVLALPFAAWVLLCRFGAPMIDWVSDRLGQPTHLVQAWEQHVKWGDAIVLALGLGGGAVILLVSYWRTALPEALRERLRGLIRRPRARRGRP